MRSKQAKHSPETSTPKQGWLSARFWVWLIVAGTSLFFWPSCLDRYLAPRFLFLSLALLAVLWWLRKQRIVWRMDTMGWLLLGWYFFHLIALSWAFSWSEGIFYVQKSGLLFGVYFVMRQLLWLDEAAVRRGLREAVTGLTIVVCSILMGQLAFAASQEGWDNNALYEYASALSGNKSLAADFLFFLLIFNILYRKNQSRRWVFPVAAIVILILIALLQVRTVYVVTALFAILYFPLRVVSEADFRLQFQQHFKRNILLLGAGLAVSVALMWTTRTGSLSERLNPMTYLESTSMNERRFVWYKTDLLNAEHPWWGVGTGSWKFLFPAKNIEGAYRLQEEGIVFTRAHNDYLEIRAEMGLVGVLYFIFLFVAAFIFLFKSSSLHRRESIIIGLGLLGYCVIQYFDFPRERIEMQVLLGLMFALSLPLTERRGISGGTALSLSGAGGRGCGALLVFMLLFNLLVSQQRIAGEMHNVRILEAQAKKDYNKMLQEAEDAENTFYEYDYALLPMVWYKGIAFYQMGQFQQAALAFERAAQLNPWSFQVLNNQATALAKVKKYREAIPVFEQVLHINPRYDNGKFNLAWVYVELNEPMQALAWIEKVDTIRNPGTEAARKTNQSVLQRKAEMATAIKKRWNME
jgi:O-antigen ligase